MVRQKHPVYWETVTMAFTIKYYSYTVQQCLCGFLSSRKSIVVQTTILCCTRVDLGGQMKEFIDIVGAVTIANQNCKRE